MKVANITSHELVCLFDQTRAQARGHLKRLHPQIECCRCFGENVFGLP
jgi:hypothetical protein